MDFYAANITSYKPVVLEYANFLLEEEREKYYQSQKKINKALEFLAHFDIVVQNNIIGHSDVVVEELIDRNDALSSLLSFFDKFKHSYNIWNTRRKNSQNLFSSAMLELAFNFQKNGKNIIAT